MWFRQLLGAFVGASCMFMWSSCLVQLLLPSTINSSVYEVTDFSGGIAFLGGAFGLITTRALTLTRQSDVQPCVLLEETKKCFALSLLTGVILGIPAIFIIFDL